MKELKLLSWNVNGIRALVKKKIYGNADFYEWLKLESPDILCLQETKAHPEQVPNELLEPLGYKSFWDSGERKGYSGVVTYYKEEPLKINTQLGKDYLDSEGRHIFLEYPNFVVINSYFPNGKKDDERLNYKMEYYEVFLTTIEKYRSKGLGVIFCGDVNTAHNEIDLTHPKENENISGFLPIERAWIDKIITKGYVDTFRHFYPDKLEQYTWWSTRAIGARERNVGWRLDYFFVNKEIIDNVTDAFILPDVLGSDHCPVGIKIKL
ncbi:MAG: exodeoxyribonuclease III [Asgard group archaeon]|nr:exodeoxyribonuclease III [Asgard group archaeon]